MGLGQLNLTSFSENASICLELSNGKVNSREAKGGVLAHANDFQGAEFQKDALHFNTAVFEDSKARMQSLERAGETLKTDFTWGRALAALGSHKDAYTGEMRIFGNAPSVVTTIQSIGIDPKEKCIYISNRSETPTGIGPYVKLPFSYADLTDSPAVVKADLSYDADFLQALHFYHLAYVSWQVEGEDAVNARNHIREASKLKSADPSFETSTRLL